jgi:hypothetical protein
MSNNSLHRTCKHKRRRAYCKQCKGNQICKHSKIRGYCKKCGGSQICAHDKVRSTCKICHGGAVCEHNKQRVSCSLCNPKSVYKRYKSRGQRNGLPFSLSFRQFVKIVLKPRENCGESAVPRGIDRKNNNLGYTPNNSQSYCIICNKMKLTMSQKDFDAHLEKIFRFKGKS